MQKIPILNGQAPIVQTGAEYIVPQLTSTKFAYNAKLSGKVIDVKENESITIQYDNGQTKTLDILPRYSATKRNSTIQVSMDSLKKGDKFEANQMVAWSKIFDSNGILANGRNVILAVMNYMGDSLIIK